MGVKPPRKFGVLDIIILVAAMVVGAISIRPFLRHGTVYVDTAREFSHAYSWTLYPAAAVNLIEPWLAVLTVACLLLRLRQPRPGLTRLMRQPGMAACLVAVLVMGVNGVFSCVTMAVIGAVPEEEDLYFEFLPYLFKPAGAAIGTVWIVMALARMCRPDSGWVDRAGRVLGGCWIFVFLLISWDDYSATARNLLMRPPPLTPAQKAQREQKEKASEKEVNAILKELEEQRESALQKEVKALQKKLQVLEQQDQDRKRQLEAVKEQPKEELRRKP